MDWIKKHFTGVNAALSASAIMCTVQFVSSLVGIFRNGIDGSAIEQLLASFDGFESVILFFVMIVLNKKKK